VTGVLGGLGRRLRRLARVEIEAPAPGARLGLIHDRIDTAFTAALEASHYWPGRG
jgi:hypothetical protein